MSRIGGHDRRTLAVETYSNAAIVLISTESDYINSSLYHIRLAVGWCG